MKLYFMKKEALDILKSNLDMVYNMYFTEKDNKWLWKVCGGDPFVEFKEIQDFQLAPIDSDTSKGEVEFANCKIIYQHLSFLTESQACDERLWAGLCHSVYYDYLTPTNLSPSPFLLTWHLTFKFKPKSIGFPPFTIIRYLPQKQNCFHQHLR